MFSQLQRQKSEARLGSTSSFPESPQSFDDDQMQGPEDSVVKLDHDDFENSDRETASKCETMLGDNTLAERNEYKSEVEAGTVNNTESDHGMGFQSSSSFESNIRSVGSQDDSTVSPGSAIQAQVTLSQESSPMTSQPDTSHQLSPTVGTDCKPSTYTEFASSADSAQRSNTSPLNSGQSILYSQSNTQLQQTFTSVSNQVQSSLSSGLVKSASSQGTYGGVNPGVASREGMTNSSDSFFAGRGCNPDFPSGAGQFSVRAPINGGYNLMDNYSQAFPGDRQISRTSKGNLPTNYGNQQISGHKSNQLSPMEKQSSLQAPEQKLYSYAVETSARVDTGYKSGNSNTQFHYTSNFNMNSNTYTHPRGYSGYNNGLHGDNINLHGSMSTEEFDGQNHQLKQGPFTSGQLNVYQNGIYHDGYYGAPFNAGVNRTMSAALLSQQSYLNTSPALHGSNMAENNGNFEQYNNMETTLNGDFGSLFGDIYNFSPQHGFPT